MWKVTLGISIALFALLWRGPAVQASPDPFNPNLIIYDDEYSDWQSMTLNQVQEFLNTKGGILKSYSINGKSAAQLIYESATTWHVSEKLLLVTLQKEQSLIEQAPSSQRALDYAMGYGCPTNGSCSPDTAGFDKQIDYAGWQYRRYLDQISTNGHTISGWTPGVTKATLDGDLITPQNSATASLYTYTPHISGNYSFWKIWKRYNFDLQRIYPTGALLRAQGDPNVWLIQGSHKRRFTNSAAFLSRYSFAQVITVPSDHLLLYDTGTEISYANYSLIASPSGGIYMLSDDTKRPIRSREAFSNAGFRFDEVIHVGWDVLNQFPDGEEIRVDNVYPSGRLLQNNQSGAVWYVQNGVRHPIVCREILRSQFGLQRPVPVPPAEIEKYTYGGMVGFKDSDLVTAGTTAYVISNGQKMPIADPATFNAYRFSWGNLQRVIPQCLQANPDGPLLDIANPILSASH